MQECKGALKLCYRWCGTAWDCTVTMVMFHRETAAEAVALGTCESSTLDSTKDDVAFQVLGCRECLVPLLGAKVMVASPVGGVFSLRYWGEGAAGGEQAVYTQGQWMQDRQGTLQRWEPKSHSARKEGQLETMLQAVEDKGKDSHDGGDWKLVTSDNTDWS